MPDASESFAVLLDRDGTLIEDRHYLCDPNQIVLLPGVIEALTLLNNAKCQLFLVSNQSGVGRGYFPESAVIACQKRLDSLLAFHFLKLRASVWCPHAPEANCLCRKPRPGLWKKLAKEYILNPQTSVMIGDKKEDLDFAVNAGLAAGILLLTGKGTDACRQAGWKIPESGSINEQESKHSCRLFVASDMLTAAKFLLEKTFLQRKNLSDS